jgi:hypothetical protein
MHAAFRTATWGVIVSGVGGRPRGDAVTGPLGILDATRVVMAPGTLLAAFSFVPAIGIQPLLDKTKREKESAAGAAPALAESAS